jgi:hypothetical protein
MADGRVYEFEPSASRVRRRDTVAAHDLSFQTILANSFGLSQQFSIPKAKRKLHRSLSRDLG